MKGLIISTCYVQRLEEPHTSNVIFQGLAVVALMSYNAMHRVSRVKQRA